MKIYIAARFVDWVIARRAEERLRARGHVCTSSWIGQAESMLARWRRADQQRRLINASRDLDDLRSADALLVLVPKDLGTGMWIELGFALARDTRVLCVGPVRERTIFGELCEQCWTIDDALDALDALAAKLEGMPE